MTSALFPPSKSPTRTFLVDIIKHTGTGILKHYNLARLTHYKVTTISKSLKYFYSLTIV